MPYDLTNFRLGEMLTCSLEVRRIARSLPTMEATLRRICGFFYDELRDADQRRACALVRAYKVHPYRELPSDLQGFAGRALASSGTDLKPSGATRCITLLATVGDEDPWKDSRRSLGHQAIPLASEEMVQRAPMISQLIRQFGLNPSDIVRPRGEVVRDLEGKTYGVFHVEEANGSPHIPAQATFVQRFGIKSVLGFGGSVVGTDLFAVILFSRAHISVQAADRFRTIALDVKAALVPFADGPVFDDN